jgi:hypothetical protein
MSEFQNLLFFVIYIMGMPIVFIIGFFSLSFYLAQKFDFLKSLILVSLLFAIAFYVFRLYYVLILSMMPAYEGSLGYNLSRVYEDLFAWVDTGECLFYIFDRRAGIHLPDVLYENWLGVSVMEVGFYLFLGVIISVAAMLWKRKLPGKLGAVLLLLPTMAFYLNVIVHWMYLAMRL